MAERRREPMLGTGEPSRGRAPMKSAGTTESRISMSEVIPIYKGSTVADIGGVVKHHSPVVPVESPVMPSPAKAAEEPNSKADTKREVGAAKPDSWIWVPSRPRDDRSPINQPRIVTWNIHHVWIGRFDGNRLSLRRYGLLGCALQITRLLRPLTHYLHRLHYVVLLIHIGVAERRGPGKVLVHVAKHRRKLS